MSQAWFPWLPLLVVGGIAVVAGAAEALPDLVATSFTAPADVSSQQVVSVTWRVENQGDATAAASWTDTVYFSVDDVCCSGDTVLRNVNRAANLNTGANYTPTTTVTMPAVIAGGYHLFVKTDSQNVKSEGDEANNVFAVPMTLRNPDLVPLALYAPDEWTAGTRIDLAWQAENQGQGEAARGWWDGVWLSTDTACCSGDWALASLAHGAELPAGANYTQPGSPLLPNVAEGDYHLLLRADITSERYESDESNNALAAKPIHVVTPDLVPVAFTAPSEGIAGEPVAVTFTVENQGNGFADASNADPSFDRVWLSNDTVCCTGDTEFYLMHDFAAPAAHRQATRVDPGGNYSVSVQVRGPDRLPCEACYIILKADSHFGQSNPGYIYEGNESNNVLVLPYRHRVADLQPVSLDVEDVVSSDDMMWVNWTGRNAGDGDAVAFWWDALSFGTQANCCPGNGFQRIGKVQNTANLSAGAEYTRNVSVRAYAAVAQTPGTYNLFVQLDKEQDFASSANNVVEPSAEGNNWLRAPFTIVIPDLVPTEVTAPASVKKGQVINVTWSARNGGEGRAVTDWQDRLQLFPTPAGFSSFFVSEPVATNLEPGDAYTRTRSLTVPNWPAGVYTLNLTVDRVNNLHEWGNGTIEPPNNTLLLTLAIQLPDLVVKTAQAPAVAGGDATLDVAWTVRNDGSEKATAPWKDAVYLSADATLDAGDTRLGEVAHTANLTDGAERDVALAVTLPGLESGAYYLLVVADDGKAVVEGYEGNNLRALAIDVDSTPPETTVDAAPGALVASADATFAFSADEAATFECRLDGGAFAACAPPHDLSGLADGAHTFDVRATDLVGNVDPTPASATWTVDTTPPDTTLVEAPAALVNVATATLSFEATEAGTFACALDGAALAPCASPITFDDLADGLHTFVVAATDAAGNTDPSPAEASWTVDRTPPETSIDDAPAAYVASGDVSVAFSANEASTFACALDGGAFEACSAPHALEGLADGAHTFEVRATDLAGNTDATPATASWTVDTTAPVVVLERPVEALYVLDGEVVPTVVLAVALGDLTVRGLAADDLAPVTSVRFLVDGTPVDAADVAWDPVTGVASFVWHEPLLALHDIVFEATNAAGLVGSDAGAFLAVGVPPELPAPQVEGGPRPIAPTLARPEA